MQNVFALAAGILLFVSLIIYIVSIVCGKTVPTRGSWVTWATVDTALIIGMYAEGTVNPQILVGAMGTIMVALLSFRYGTPTWTWLEKTSLKILPVGLLLWGVSGNARWNISISLILITIGCLPTYQSMWEKPELEDRVAWTTAFVSSIAMVLALPPITFAWEMIEVSAQPITFLLTQIPIMYLLWVRPKKKGAERCP